jgi:hypothetical protein
MGATVHSIFVNKSFWYDFIVASKLKIIRTNLNLDIIEIPVKLPIPPEWNINNCNSLVCSEGKFFPISCLILGIIKVFTSDIVIFRYSCNVTAP